MKLTDVAQDSAKGAFSLILGEAASTIILAVGSILIARLLGPARYGLYSLILVTPTLLVPLFVLGVDQAMIRFTAKHRAENNFGLAALILKLGSSFRLLIAAILSLAAFLFSDSFAALILYRPELGVYIKAVSMAVFFQMAFVTATDAFIGLDRMDKSALLKGLMSIVKAFSSVALVVIGFGVMGAVLGYVVAYLVSGVAGILMLLTWLGRNVKSQPSMRDAWLPNMKLMTQYGFPIYVASIVSTVVSQFQLMLLAYFTSNADIGNFKAAMNFTVLISVIALPIGAAIFPAFSKLNPENQLDDLRRFFTLSTKYTSLIILPVSVAVIIFAPELVSIVYGASYGLAPAFLSLWAVSFLYAGLGSAVLGNLFNGIGETKLNLRIILLNAILFVPTAWVLVRIYVVQGLIVAFLASGLISFLYGLWLARRRYAITIDLSAQARIFLTTGLSALLAFLFLRLSSFGYVLNLVLGGAVFLSAYLTIAPMLGAIRTDDIENLRLLCSRIGFASLFLKQVLTLEAKLLSAFRHVGQTVLRKHSPS